MRKTYLIARPPPPPRDDLPPLAAPLPADGLVNLDRGNSLSVDINMISFGKKLFANTPGSGLI